MSRICGALLLTVAAGCGGAEKAAAPPAVSIGPTAEEELKRFAGEWRVVKVNRELVPKPRSVVFRGSEVQFEGRGPVRFAIDPTQDPKWFDLPDEGPLPGIYRFDGGRLFIYLVNEIRGDMPAVRPASFDGDYPAQLLELARVK
jgi:uncharacterized protein (TIGR03067 family)